MQIVVALVAVFLLVRPFDCFSTSAKFDQKAKDCCKKGKCSPSNSDDCCKATVPNGTQLATSKAPDHALPALDIVISDIANTLPQPSMVVSRFVEVHAPPGSPPDFRINLPLLI